MTKTLSVPVELLERLALKRCADGWLELNTATAFQAAKELREILSAPPLIQTLHQNGDKIAIEATVRQQAEYIRLLEAEKANGWKS